MPSPITAASHCGIPQLCAHCGAILRTDSRAFAPVEYEDGLVCLACDEAAMADAAARLDPAARAFLAQAHQRAQAQRFAP